MSNNLARAPEISEGYPKAPTLISSTPTWPSSSTFDIGAPDTSIYLNAKVAEITNKLQDVNQEVTPLEIAKILLPDTYNQSFEMSDGRTFHFADYEVLWFFGESHLVENNTVKLDINGVNPQVSFRFEHGILIQQVFEDLLFITLNPQSKPTDENYKPINICDISEFDEETGEITLSNGCLGPLIACAFAPSVLGPWKLNEVIDDPNFDMGLAYVNDSEIVTEDLWLEFTSNGISYTGLVNANEDVDPAGANLVYVNGAWKNQSDRIINLTATPDFGTLEILRAIATYQGEPAPTEPTTPQFLDETGLRALATHIKTYAESRTTYSITDVTENIDSVDFTIVGKAVRVVSEPMPTDLAGITLVWNETVDGDLPTTNLSFLSDNNSYSGLENKSSILSYVSSDGARTPVYQSGEWQKGGLSSPYRTISVTGGADAASEKLIVYSQSNAVVQPKEETPEPVVPCASGHTWGDWVVITAATCTAEGSEERTCSVCGEKETRVIATIEHTWDEKGIVTTAPTYSAPGVRTFTCQVCGATKTEEIAQLVNSFDDDVPPPSDDEIL